MNKNVDSDFLALPLAAVSDAAISTAKDAGASHVDVRIERTRTGLLSLRDARPETQSDETVAGVGVRVIVDGAWGFASSPPVLCFFLRGTFPEKKKEGLLKEVGKENRATTMRDF